MADIWYDVDTALSEVPVNIMPLIDDTDFKTIEDAVAYNAAGMALFWHFTTTAGAYTVTAVTPTTGGAYDWTDQGDAGIYTIEIPASGGASINNDTEGFGWFTGVATGVLPWRGPVCGFRAAAINNSLIDGATVDVNVTAMAAGVVTATVIANGAIDADTFAADVDAEILSYIVDDATRIDASSLNTAAVTSIPAILADTSTDGVVVAAASKSGYTLTATTGLGNQTADITGSLSGSVGSVTGAVGSVTGAVGSVTGNVGGNVAGSVASVIGLTASDVGAIKTQTDKFVFTVANQVDANIQYVNDVAVTGDGQSGTEWGPA